MSSSSFRLFGRYTNKRNPILLRTSRRLLISSHSFEYDMSSANVRRFLRRSYVSWFNIRIQHLGLEQPNQHFLICILLSPHCEMTFPLQAIFIACWYLLILVPLSLYHYARSLKTPYQFYYLPIQLKPPTPSKQPILQRKWPSPAKPQHRSSP